MADKVAHFPADDLSKPGRKQIIRFFNFTI